MSLIKNKNIIILDYVYIDVSFYLLIFHNIYTTKHIYVILILYYFFFKNKPPNTYLMLNNLNRRRYFYSLKQVNLVGSIK